MKSLKVLGFSILSLAVMSPAFAQATIDVSSGVSFIEAGGIAVGVLGAAWLIYSIGAKVWARLSGR